MDWRRRRSLVASRREFESFVASTGPQLLRAATNIVGPYLAEDVVQEAYTTTWKKWETVRVMEHPVAWAKKVTTNTAIDHWNKPDNKNVASGDMAADSDEQALPTDDTGNAVSEEIYLRNLLWDLPVKQRAAAAMFYLWGFPVAEIADTLDCAPATVRQHLFRARNALRREFGLSEAAAIEKEL